MVSLPIIVGHSLQFSAFWSEIALKRKRALLRTWKKALSHTSPREVGQIGEELAACFVKKSGYKLLYRNFKPSLGGEIDLICRDGHTLVFIEVKTRVAPLRFRPSSAIDKKKRTQLKKGALQYLRMLKNDTEKDYPLHVTFTSPATRFDAVEVILRDGKPAIINTITNIMTF